MTATATTAAATTADQRAKMVEGCINLCRKLARKAAGYVPSADIDELESEAYLACVEAANKWKPDGPHSLYKSHSQAKFSTFAQSYITQRLKQLASTQRLLAMSERRADFGRIESAQCDVPDCDERDGHDCDDADAIDDIDEDAKELLAKLREPAKSIVYLTVIEGLSPEQIAEQLAIPVKDVKLHHRNSCRTLSNWLVLRDRPGLFSEVEKCHQPEPNRSQNLGGPSTVA